MKKTIIVYLIGKPGVGKYTIAKELAKSGYIICDNQLVNNPVFTLLNYDGFSKIPEYAWNVIAKIRTAIFGFIEQETNNNYILTNVLNEDDGDRNLYNQVEQMAARRDSLFIPVKFSISKEEHIKRVTTPSRRERWKSIDHEEAHSKDKLLTIKHENLLERDISKLSAAQSSGIILEHINSLGVKK